MTKPVERVRISLCFEKCSGGKTNLLSHTRSGKEQGAYREVALDRHKRDRSVLLWNFDCHRPFPLNVSS